MEKDQDLYGALGSDDQITIWLNGEQVFVHDKGRPAREWQNTFVAPARAGKNFILVKLVNNIWGWEFMLRLYEHNQFQKELRKNIHDTTVSLEKNNNTLEITPNTTPSSDIVDFPIHLTLQDEEGSIIEEISTQSGNTVQPTQDIQDGSIIRINTDIDVPQRRSLSHFDYYHGDLKAALLAMPASIPETTYLESLSPLSKHLAESAIKWLNHEAVRLAETAKLDSLHSTNYQDTMVAFRYMRELITTLTQQQDPITLFQGRAFPQLTKGQGWQDDSSLIVEYLLRLPPTLSEDNPAPVLTFLHGANYRINIGLLTRSYHELFSYVDAQKDLPFIVISPKCVPRKGWNKQPKMVISLIKKLSKVLPIDANRRYLSGFSMGANATLSLAAQHPHFFAAIAPYSGQATPRQELSLAGQSIRMITGRQDGNMPLSKMRVFVDQLNAYGSQAMISVHENVGHEALHEFNDPAFMSGY